MKTKLPPIPAGGDSMLFGVKLTDEQLDSVVSALSAYQYEIEAEIKADESPEDRGVFESIYNDIELIFLSCPDYVQAMHDNQSGKH